MECPTRPNPTNMLPKRGAPRAARLARGRASRLAGASPATPGWRHEGAPGVLGVPGAPPGEPGRAAGREKNCVRETRVGIRQPSAEKPSRRPSRCRMPALHIVATCPHECGVYGGACLHCAKHRPKLSCDLLTHRRAERGVLDKGGPQLVLRGVYGYDH